VVRRAFNLLAVLTILVAIGSPAAAGDKTLIFGVFYSGCEHLCEGVKAGIAESGLDAEIDIRDIQQDKTLLPKLVEEARAMKADLVLTVGTSVTLGTIGRLDDIGDDRLLHGIPVVFTWVADSFGARLAESFERSGRANVTGTFNRVPESVNIQVIRQYDPGFDRLGLLYNSNEQNSVIKMRELKDLLPTLGVELVALEIDPGNTGKPNPDKIPIRMAELREKGVKWVYLGSSSFLLANGELFTSSAVENGIAIVSPYENLVREQQALLSIAARLFDVGKLAAEQTLKILRDGAGPGELPIVRATDFAYVVNMAVAKKLNRFPPISFLQVAEAVN
jgi:putative tryptophan/tyrosine transport system substrate-binding protein